MRRLLCVALLLAVGGCEEKKTEDPVLLLAGTLGNSCREDGSCDTGLTCNHEQLCAAAAAIEVESEEGAALVSGDRVDFGSCLSSADQIQIKLTIENPGDFELQLTGSPRVGITGPAAAEFTVLEEPAAVVPAKGTTTVRLLFAPQQPGTRDATALIAHSAGAEPFAIALSGKGLAADLRVSLAGEPLEAGGNVDFGEVFFSDGAKTIDVTLANVGDGPLRLASQPAAAIEGVDAAAFAVVLPEVSEIPAGGEATVQLRFDPDSYGPKLASLSITTNDADAPVFGVRMNGKGEFNPERMRVIDETFDRSKTASVVRVAGNKLFVGYYDDVASGLLIYDLGTGKQAPTFAGRVLWDFDPMMEGEGNAIRDVVVNGEVAYVAQGPRGVRVIDLASESALSALPIEYAQDLAIDTARGLLAVADSSGPALFDLTDPRAPVLAHTFAGVNATSVAFAGSQLLVGDVTNYEMPQVAGFELATSLPESTASFTVPADGTPTSLAVAGNVVFVASSGWGSLPGGLSVIDLTAEPENKAGTVRTLLSTVNVFDLVLEGTKLYASVDGAGVKVFDGADVASMQETGTIGGMTFNTMALTSTALYGSTYMSGWDNGIQVFGLAEPSFEPDDTIKLRAATRAFAVGGGHAFLASGEYGLRVVDLAARGSKPATVVIETQDGGFSFDDIAYADGMVYTVSTWSSELRAYDVSAPEAPQLQSTWPLQELLGSYGAERLVVANGHAFLHGYQFQGVAVIDLASTQTTPGRIEVGGTISALLAHGNFLYAVVGEQLQTWDITDPKNPVAQQPVMLPGQVIEMAAAQGKLYLAKMSEGLAIYDLADPAAPSFLATLPPPDGDPIVVVSAIGDWVFAVSSMAGMTKEAGDTEVLMVDVSAPSAPVIAASAQLRGMRPFVTEIVATDRDVYLAAGQAGLIIVGE